MTRPQLIQDIERACQKANPLLVDFRTIGIHFKFNEKILKFEKDFPENMVGKEFILRWHQGMRNDSLIQTSDMKTQQYVYNDLYNSGLMGLKFMESQNGLKECLEILGKEPGLADVLLAVGHDVAVVGSKESKGCFLEYSERPLHGGDRDFWNHRQISWDLTKGLYSQTDETLQFLHSLLFMK